MGDVTTALMTAGRPSPGPTGFSSERTRTESSSVQRAAQPKRGLRPGVLFQARVYGGADCEDDAWNAALGLANHGIPVQLAPIGAQEDSDHILTDHARHSLESLTRQRVDLARSVLYHSAPPWDWNLNVYGRCRIGRTAFDTDRIPDGWAERCNAMDEVWVPSEFNRETFAVAGVDLAKLHVVPAGVDTHLFQPNLEPLNIPHRRNFNFLGVLDPQLGRGTDLLLKAYLMEFKPDEDVALILKTTPHSDPLADAAAEVAYFVEKKAGLTLQASPAVILLRGLLSREETASIYAAVDAFVFPTHGEAYGRPLLEALACELPVIATRWGGQLDYLNDENSYLIDIQGLVPASTAMEHIAGHSWAQPSLDHLRQLMRRVYTRREEAQRRATRGRADLVEGRDWSVLVPRWISEFRRLLE